MDIKPTDRTVKNVLEGGFYRIPRFQRPYSWDKENVDDFWTDTVTTDDPDYFIGAFVLHRQHTGSDVFMVVDGQQRLTTITLLLAALRNALDSLGFDDLGAGVQKLIERQDINYELQFVLQSETPYPFLQEYIQKRGNANAPPSRGREEEALQLAFGLIETKVKNTLEAIEGDETIPAHRKKHEERNKLIAIRDKILGLQLIMVVLGNEDDAYMIFETLNTRGKNLGVGDLVKNHLTRLLRPTNKGVDVARDKWNGMLQLFDASAADLRINRFIYHSWLSRYPYLGEKSLFKEIKRAVKHDNAMHFLDDLVHDAELYRRIFEPDTPKWGVHERDIKLSIRALNLFRVMQPVPMLIALLRSYYSKQITAKQLRGVLRDMENFHVQFTAVTSQRTGGGTARMYAASAQDLVEAQDRNAREHVLRDFVNKMRARIPVYQEFEANFSQIVYLSDYTKQKPLVQYLLERFDSEQRTGAVVDYSAMTIEHIAPEHPSAQSTALKDHVGLLGNLILLPADLNVKLANKSFKVKKKAYEENGVPLDPILAGANRWTDEEIDKRTGYLAEQAYKKIFKV